jgi:hypothetical protein
VQVLQERVAVLEGQKQEALAGQQGKGAKIVGDQHPSISECAPLALTLTSHHLSGLRL